MSKASDKAKSNFTDLTLEEKQKLYPELGVILTTELTEEEKRLAALISGIKEFKESINKQ